MSQDAAATRPADCPAMRVAYPFTVAAHGDRWRVALADVPEADAEADSARAAIAFARRRLAAVLQAYVEADGALPRPSPAGGREVLAPPVLAAAKLLLLEALYEHEATNVALAARLDTPEGAVRRLLDLQHRSHIDAVEAALTTLGKRFVLEARSPLSHGAGNQASR